MNEGGSYEIRIKGHLDIRWAAWFDGLSLAQDSDGTTVIRGWVADQAAPRPAYESAQSRLAADRRHSHLSGENIVRTTDSSLIRAAGLSAMAAGTLFVFVQLIHPPELLSSVTTSTWVIVHCLSVAMCVFWLFGITGIYARQVKESGWLGLAGFIVWSLFLVLTAAFTFVEAFILPVLAAEAPKFVEGFLGIERGTAGAANVGALSTVYSLAGVLYLLGGMLFGIATFRAGILPRLGAGLLAVGTVMPVALSLLPHEYIRLAAVPVGCALVWLGFALWSERRDNVAEAVSRKGRAQLRQTESA